MPPSGKTAGSLIKSHAARGPHLMAPLRAAAVGLALTLGLLGPAGALPAPEDPADVSSDSLITVCVDGNLWTADGGFEATNSMTLVNPNYATTSVQFGYPDNPDGSPLCNIGNGTCSDGGPPRTGNSWAWFGGNDGTPTPIAEIASAQQTITFPAGASSATLKFYLKIRLVTAPFAPSPLADTLEVQVDGVTQQTYVEPAVAEATYTLRSVDLSAFADGAAHAVKFLYTQNYVDPAGIVPNIANFDVDDVTLEITCAPLTPMALAVDTSGNGVLEPGEIASVEPTWKNGSAAPIHLTGDSSNFTGPSGPAYSNPGFASDYGTIGAGASQACATCYTAQVTGTRPVPHWDTTIDEAAGAGAKTWTLHVGDSFADVPHDAYYPFIETIFHHEITAGCLTGYCPSVPAKRSQMAVFLLKAKEGSGYLPPTPAVGIFGDVDPADSFAPWIEELYNRGITAGCNAAPLLYCPNQDVLRQEMAVFLLKTLEGSAYDPPACQGLFPDVPCSSGYAKFIEEIFNRGITAGCGAPGYCPTNSNTRGEAAAFLTKTFGLVLYGP